MCIRDSYNLTGSEFIIAGLLFAWLMLFVRQARAYADAAAPAPPVPAAAAPAAA